jgi:hypothetical protein
MGLGLTKKMKMARMNFEWVAQVSFRPAALLCAAGFC